MRISLLALLALLATLVLPAPLMADTYTYAYIGNDFDTFSQIGAPQLYNSANFVAGEFTLSAPLAANLNGFPLVSPLSFNFTDGIDTVTDSSPLSNTFFDIFQFNTDANGSIVGWAALVATQIGNIAALVGTEHKPSGTIDFAETLNVQTQDCDVVSCEVLSGSVEDLPGVWTITTTTSAATPEPAPLLLVVTGIVASAVAFRRRAAYP
jgi:hypothetical protein